MQPGQPGGSDWSWTTPYPGRFAVRLKVEGDGAIENPQFTTPEGVIKFPCTVKEHQYLLYTFDGKAVVTDKNCNVVQTVVPEGEALMPAGTSAVSFSCKIWLRFPCLCLQKKDNILFPQRLLFPVVREA